MKLDVKGSGVQRTGGRRWLPAVMVFIGGVLPFLPVLQNGFFDWDDNYWLVENPWHEAPLATRLASSWSTSFMYAYMPVTLMTFVLDRAVWGVEPKGYHLTNLLLHGLTAVAVHWLARRLIVAALVPEGPVRGSTIEVGAAIAALVFAVHPLRAEPVAWLTARATVLGGLLVVLATVVYLEGWKRGRATGEVKASWLWGSVLVFALALLARSTGLVLPALLVLLDIYPLRRLGGSAGWTGPAARRVWLEKIPFTALAVASVPVAVLTRGGFPSSPFGKSWFGLHLWATAIYTTGWSVAVLIAPVDLKLIYDLPSRARPGGYIAAALVVFALTTLAVAGRDRWPSALAAWAATGILLLPVSIAISGSVVAGPQDRYTYLPGVVAGLLAGGGAALAWSRYVDSKPSVRTAVVMALIVLAVSGTWAALTWRQCRVWGDDDVGLLRQQVQAAPRSVVARNRYARALEREGDLEGALEQYRELARLWPSLTLAEAQIGSTLLALGRSSEAETVLREAVDAAPNDSHTRLGLGRVLAARGMVAEALEEFNQALRSDPRSPEVHLALGQTLARASRADEAREHVRQALALRPGWQAAETLRATLDTTERSLPRPSRSAPRRKRTRCPRTRAHPFRPGVEVHADQAHQLRFRQGRLVGRAQAPPPEVGHGGQGTPEVTDDVQSAIPKRWRPGRVSFPVTSDPRVR